MQNGDHLKLCSPIEIQRKPQVWAIYVTLNFLVVIFLKVKNKDKISLNNIYNPVYQKYYDFNMQSM